MIIEAQNIRKSFGTLEVLKGVDIVIGQGEIVSIVGTSGAGKTTLLQILGTLDRADSGHLHIDGTDITTLNNRRLAEFRNRRLGFIFQFHRLLPEFTALENVMIPALIAGMSQSEAALEAEHLLAELNLKERATHKPSELSGGEKQRIAVARALINRPAIILADEPSGSLDSTHKEELHALFFRLCREMGQTFLIVTHDEKLAAGTDRILRMHDGLLTSD